MAMRRSRDRARFVTDGRWLEASPIHCKERQTSGSLAAEAIARDRALAAGHRAFHGAGEPPAKDANHSACDDGTEEVVTESDPERLALQRARLALEFLARRWPHDYARCKIPFVSPAQAARFLKESICVSETAHRNISSNRICKPLASAARLQSPVVARNPFPGRPGRVAFWWR